MQSSDMAGLQREIVQATRPWDGAHNIVALLDMLEAASGEQTLVLYLRNWASACGDPSFTWFLLAFEERGLSGAPLFLVLEDPHEEAP